MSWGKRWMNVSGLIHLTPNCSLINVIQDWHCWWQCRGSPPGRLHRYLLPSWPSSAPSRRRWRAGPAWRGWPSQSSLTTRSSTHPPAPVAERERLDCDWRKAQKKRENTIFLKKSVYDTYIIILFKVCLFDFLPLEWAAVCQDVDDGLLISPWRTHHTKQMQQWLGHHTLWNVSVIDSVFLTYQTLCRLCGWPWCQQQHQNPHRAQLWAERTKEDDSVRLYFMFKWTDYCPAKSGRASWWQHGSSQLMGEGRRTVLRNSGPEVFKQTWWGPHSDPGSNKGLWPWRVKTMEVNLEIKS